MTDVGSAVFAAQWRAMEAKIVECQALTDAMQEFKMTYGQRHEQAAPPGRSPAAASATAALPAQPKLSA